MPFWYFHIGGSPPAWLIIIVKVTYAMVDRPILFSGPMVRALLAGRKTQTRRLLKVPGIMGGRYSIRPPESAIELDDGEFARGVWHYASTGALSGPYRLPHAVGDRLYVREHWRTLQKVDGLKPSHLADDISKITYLADPERANPLWAFGKHRRAMHMPRWASRITLHVEGMRVEPVQDISERDALAEGIIRENVIVGAHGSTGSHIEITADRHWIGTEDDDHDGDEHAAETYARLWDSLHAIEGERWDDNPLVTVTTFRVELGNIDQIRSEAA